MTKQLAGLLTACGLLTDIKDFREEAHTGRDQAAVRFAAKTLPTLHMHLRMAGQIAGSGRVK